MAMRYLLISIYTAVFSAVYELFSHEVYSFYMIYAFGFPLVGGTLPFLTLSILQTIKFPDIASRRMYHAGIATLTVGSLIKGILDIYGTTNSLVVLYWIVGVVLCVGGTGKYLYREFFGR